MHDDIADKILINIMHDDIANKILISFVNLKNMAP